MFFIQIFQRHGLFRQQRSSDERGHGVPEDTHAIRRGHDKGMVQRVQGEWIDIGIFTLIYL